MKTMPLLIAGFVGLGCAAAQAASFDCRKAAHPDEKAVCADRSLNDMDVELATTYRLLGGLFAMGVRGEMQDAQDDWLAKRRQCKSDKACLRNVYRQRLEELKRLYEKIDKPI